MGEGASAKSIPRLSGTISRSSELPGEMVSTALSDTDLDGKMEFVAATLDAIAVYSVEGDELREKARIPNAGPGLFHVDAADVTRNGVADIIAVRYAAGTVLSDIWQYDGKEYRKITSGLPYFLRTADLGPEGIVLLGQASDPATVFKGPVFRVTVDRGGKIEMKDHDRPLPLPEGTFLYGFTALRQGKGVRYAALTDRNRILYLDETGKALWEGLDAVTGTEITIEGTGRRLQIPGRMAAVDINQDGTDELVVLNDLVAAERISRTCGSSPRPRSSASRRGRPTCSSPGARPSSTPPRAISSPTGPSRPGSALPSPRATAPSSWAPPPSGVLWVK